MKLQIVPILCLVLAACGTGDSGSTDRDTGSDTADSGFDTTDDTNPDTGEDVVVDIGPDTTDDTGLCSIPEPENRRPEGGDCDQARPTDGPFLDPGAEEWSDCTSHDDCTDGINGRCTGNSHDGWYCTYDQCFEDAECTGGPCGCGAGFRSDHNVCLGGNCQSDADCGENSYCSPTYGDCGEYSGVVAYYCRTCEDECTNDSDCTDGDPNGFGPGYCMFNPSVGHWICSYSHCAG